MADIASVLSIRIRSMIAQAAGDAVGRSSPVFQAASEAVLSGVKSRAAFTNAHKDLARAAQRSVVSSYNQTVTARQVGPSGYRSINGGSSGQGRYSGRALFRALQNPDTFQGTFQGIEFANEDILNREARHWARLNWGAAPRARLEAYVAPVRLGGQGFGELVFEPPSDVNLGPFGIPPGFWREGAFYPSARSPLYATRGIQGRRFFDAGIRAIAKELPNRYFDLVAELLDTAQRRGTGAGTHITVTPSELGL